MLDILVLGFIVELYKVQIRLCFVCALRRLANCQIVHLASLCRFGGISYFMSRSIVFFIRATSSSLLLRN